MAESEFDIESLKQTLCAQKRLLQKLYNELDAEREASSTAACETLSMILRLQGEKAAMKLESEQYKRLSEEKMNYAEESLAIFEDVMYQKEMEVTAMDYQVQAYRYKLLSMGCTDPVTNEIKFPETLGRRNSAPSLALKYLKKSSPETYLCNINDQNSDSEKKTDSSITGNINTYWEEIKNLDGRVKEISGFSYVNLSRSSSPQLSSDSSSYDLTKESIVNEVEHSSKTVESSGCSPNVLDVFEVPSVNLDKMVQYPNCVLEEESDLLKKIITSSNHKPNIQCNMAFIRPEIVEIEQESMNREEELRLLNEIKEQLNSMQSQITCLKTTNKQNKQRNDSSLAMLSEEMLHFWL